MRHSYFKYSLVALVAMTLAVPALAQDDQGGGRRGGGQRGGQAGGERGGQGRGGSTQGRQRGGFGRQMTIDKATLLGSEQVRGELKIGEEQAPRVDELLASYREETRELRGGFRRGGRGQGEGGERPSEEERQKQRKENAEKLAKIQKAFDGKVAKVLEKEQVKRLDEIHFQQQGVEALVSDTVAAALKLKKEQVSKIKGLIEGRDKKLAELREGAFGGGRGGQGGRGNFEEMRKRFEEMREKTEVINKESEKEILAVLDEDQSKAHKALAGKPFELDRRSLFRRGGRGGDQGGRGGDQGGRAGGGRGGRGGQGGDSDRPRRRPGDDEV